MKERESEFRAKAETTEGRVGGKKTKKTKKNQFSLLNDADCECLAIKIQTPTAPTISCQERSAVHCHFLDLLQWGSA